MALQCLMQSPVRQKAFIRILKIGVVVLLTFLGLGGGGLASPRVSNITNAITYALIAIGKSDHHINHE